MPAGRYSIGSDVWPGLSKLIEECGEVQQVAGKIIATNGESAHWDGTDLRQRLTEEIADMIAAGEFLAAANHLDDVALEARVQHKRALFWQWQREQSAIPSTPPAGAPNRVIEDESSQRYRACAEGICDECSPDTEATCGCRCHRSAPRAIETEETTDA